MVGVMDDRGDSEGLFLKNYLGTVSAVPRTRTASHVDCRSFPVHANYKNCPQNGMPRTLYTNEIGHRNGELDDDIIQADNDEEKEKKKERKWILGGFFRRKTKKDGDDSSNESDDGKKGFLSRRKSKQDRRKAKSRNITNGFDVVVPPKETSRNGEISVEQLWSGKSNETTSSGPVRYIHRHPEPLKANSLHVPRHSRRDSNLSRSSGGSDHADGRRGRKEVMARAEAKRDLMRDESSSDEYESYHSTSSLNRFNGEVRRPRRTDRHKRWSRDDDDRVTKSDLEASRRLPPNCKWISRTCYPESDQMNLMNHSATPSPCRSPRARQKQLLEYMMVQNNFPTSTFPPGAHHQIQLSRSHAKGNYPLNYGSQSSRTNRISNHNLPRSLSSSENSNRKTLRDYEHYLSFCGAAKSASFDQNIHRASYFENEPDSMRNIHAANHRKSSNRAEAPTDAGGLDIYNHNTAKTYNGVLENRTDSTPSLPTGTLPAQAVDKFCETSYKFNSQHHDPIPTTAHLNGSPSILRYYADQNPRSRNPIHITCNPTTPEHPYLSDSQMTLNSGPPARASASDFWRLKDQQLVRQQKKLDTSLKPPQSGLKPDTSRSSSPRANPPNGLNAPAERKIPKEEFNTVAKSPPEPPVRRLSKQEVLTRLQKCEQLKNKEKQIRMNMKNEAKVHNSNLDEALNELEVIYNSLRLKDEDLVDRAERRDFPAFSPKNPITSVSVRDKIQNFYAEADYPKTVEPVRNVHQRAVPLRRSGVPDKTTDDMAFRRLHHKDRVDAKPLPPQSYLRSSPALSPSNSPAPRKDSPVAEPDVTLDDVVFRTFRHANSTLKVQDPQPPFGIPIGIIAPAPNSDYLHATPTDRFRPTFTSSKTPDVVKDDLAFRNLRKDGRAAVVDPTVKSDLKKRAVRSLSANLYNIMQKENPHFAPLEANNNVISESQSLTDLSKGKEGLEKRLKELKEERNAKRAEFFELSRKKNAGSISWADLVDLNGNFDDTRERKTEEAGKKFRSPVVELSKYPAAAPSSTLQGNPFKEPSLDDDQLENLLSALAKEAENASKDLERKLDALETKKPKEEQRIEENSKAIEEFNKKFQGLDKGKRRRNLSLSSATESKEDMRQTGSLERRKKAKKNFPPFEELLQERSKETKASESREQQRSQSFEVVTDLSQILHDVEVQQQLNDDVGQKETNSVFLEVYEYNCRRSSADRETAPAAEATPRSRDSDLESEFERLHKEAGDGDLLRADVAGVEQREAGGGSWSLPFPREGGTESGGGCGGCSTGEGTERAESGRRPDGDGRCPRGGWERWEHLVTVGGSRGQ